MSKRNNISLYIDGKKADIDDDAFILFNYSIDDISNPTVVKNSYSQQITLKGTPRNNDIFGSLWRNDRYTDNGSFNPMSRTSFAVYSDTGDILESGYIKVDNVTRSGKNAEYKVSLYGGLGSFFYSLSYREDGNPKTLADLLFDVPDTDFNMTITKSIISAAWAALTSDGSGIYDIINFAPAYNGIPQGNFDTKNVAAHCNKIARLQKQVTVDGVNYYTFDSFTMVAMPNNVTEWQVKDLRSYLQRPVLSVSALINAIFKPINNGGYNVVLDPDIQNGEINGAWLTLPMIDITEHVAEAPVTITKSSLLDGMGSPASWLLAIAKMFNWKFLYDCDTKTVNVLANHNFYRDNIVDISGRIDRREKDTIVPLPMDKRWLRFGLDNVSEFAETYKTQYDTEYGTVKVDTSYPFNADEEDVLSGAAGKAAVTITETSPFYRTMSVPDTNIYYPALFLQNGLRQTLWSSDGKSIDVDLLASYYQIDDYDNGNDYFAKLQLHGADNKAIDGSGVLCWFNGNQSVAGCRFYISDDANIMTQKNGGVACFILDGRTTSISSPIDFIPQFSRYKVKDSVVVASLDFGNPREVPVPDISMDSGAGVYARNWRDYIADRYNRESRILTCMMHWGGAKVGQHLFRDFYWIDNAIWTLRSIKNHSLTTFDATECEFIKVEERENYMRYFPVPNPTPGEIISITINGVKSFVQEVGASGELFDITVKASDGATISVDSSAMSWAYSYPDFTKVQVLKNTTEELREGTMIFKAIKNGISAIAKLVIKQAPAVVTQVGVLGISPEGNINASNEGEVIAFDFTTYPRGTVLMSSTKGWCTWNQVTGNLTIDRNNTASDRSCTITFYLQGYYDDPTAKVKTINVTQAAASQVYTLTLSKYKDTVPFEGGSVTFSYRTNGTLRYDAPTSSRISISSISGGYITVTCTKNPTTDNIDSVGYIKFYVAEEPSKYVTFSVAQEGTDMFIYISPTYKLMDAAGGTVIVGNLGSPDFYFNSNLDPAYIEASVGASWIKLDSVSGSGYAFLVAANPGTGRRYGLITFRSKDDADIYQTIAIEQKGINE